MHPRYRLTDYLTLDLSTIGRPDWRYEVLAPGGSLYQVTGADLDDAPSVRRREGGTWSRVIPLGQPAGRIVATLVWRERYVAAHGSDMIVAVAVEPDGPAGVIVQLETGASWRIRRLRDRSGRSVYGLPTEGRTLSYYRWWPVYECRPCT